MGMDVHSVGDHYLVSGQVILSSPGEPCLRCFGLVTDEALEAEGARYGDAGGRPQVVWPNGVLASTATGLMVQALTPWHSKPLESVCLEYDGNKHTVSDRKSTRLNFQSLMRISYAVFCLKKNTNI